MEEELGGLIHRLVLTILPNDPDQWKPKKFLIVGRLLTDKKYNMEALIGTMKMLWTPRKQLRERNRISAVVLEGSDRVVFSFS